MAYTSFGGGTVLTSSGLRRKPSCIVPVIACGQIASRSDVSRRVLRTRCVLFRIWAFSRETPSCWSALCMLDGHSFTNVASSYRGFAPCPRRLMRA